MKRYPKHLLVIREKQYNIGNDISLVESYDKVFVTGSFSIPFISTTNWSTDLFRKYDKVQIYFKSFDTPIERDLATIDSLTLIFDGYIDTLELPDENKTSGSNYNVNIKSTMGLTYERSTEVKFFNGNIFLIVNTGLAETFLSSYIDNIIVTGVSPNFIMKISSTYFFGKVLEDIKSKYAIKIFQRKKDLIIKTPVYFNSDTSINTYQYDLQKNVFSINYGEITKSVNCVVVYGNNTVGIAFDPIAYQLAQGVQPENVVSNITPNKSWLNPLYLYRRDLFDTESCQKVAREKLVDLAKNYTISFNTEFDPDQSLGDVFFINNSNKIPATQKWIIKQRNIKISKNNITCEIIGYSNSISDFPSDILLSPSGILDTDILNVSKDVTTAFDIRG